MYAAIHIPNGGGAALLGLGKAFSPEVEETDDGLTIVFSIGPLVRLIGGPEEVASEIARRASERGLHGQIGIAANPEVAILTARHTRTLHIIPAGEERRHLGRLPIEALFQNSSADLEALEILDRWGIRTVDDFTKLPEAGVAERLGSRGLALLKLVRGESKRPLRPVREGVRYDERIETDHPIALLEPLLFLISRLLNELCARLRTHSRATTEIRLELELENATSHTRLLQLPFPTHDAKALVKLVQLDLEAHPPTAPIQALTIAVTPVEPRVVQHGLYTPPAPEPERLELTLSKIRAMVGDYKAGSPELLNTFKPDAWRMRATPPGPKQSMVLVDDEPGNIRLAFRYFRPPLEARVELAAAVPKRVFATGVWGAVVQAAGPWRASGEWWTGDDRWSREEWDIALNDGAVYRLYAVAQRWFLDGMYD